MAILAFQKPDKVLMLEADSRFGKFEFRPLEPGFGITVGNALRRILLSSLEGFAITTIKIDGVEHEFSSVPGAKEDVTNIILNLKQVRFKQVVEEFESEKVSITVENSSEFKAGDIGKYLTGFEVLNPELVICHLDSKSTMQIDITINKGRGYVPADENREYYRSVFSLLNTGFQKQPYARFAAIPSFSPEYAMSVEKRNGRYTLVSNTLSRTYWQAEKGTVTVDTKSVVISASLYQSLGAIFRLVTEQVQDLDGSTAGLDGIVYFFSSTDAKGKEQMGRKWSTQGQPVTD